MDSTTLIALASLGLNCLATLFSTIFNYQTVRFTEASNARAKQVELHQPEIYAALAELTNAYAEAITHPVYEHSLPPKIPEYSVKFIAAASKLAALINDCEIRQMLLSMTQSGFCFGNMVTTADTQAFAVLISSISQYLAEQ